MFGLLNTAHPERARRVRPGSGTGRCDAQPAQAALTGVSTGPQKAVAMTRDSRPGAGRPPEPVAPIHVPIGVLEQDAADALSGTPFALVPAKEWSARRGIGRPCGTYTSDTAPARAGTRCPRVA